MGIDEALFGRLHRWWRARRQLAIENRRLEVAAAEPRLRHLLGVLHGGPLRLSVGSDLPRADVAAALPEYVAIHTDRADAEAVMQTRLALAAAAAALGLGSDQQDPVAATAAWQQHWPRLWQWLDAEWPGARALLAATERHRQALPGDEATRWLATFGRLPLPAAAAKATVTAPIMAPREALPNGTERQQHRRRAAEVVELPPEDDGANPLAHVFEKVKTAEEHTGGNRTPDGDDELDQHLDALDDLDLRAVVRSHRATASVFRADVDFATAPAELVDAGTTATIQYDEWDERTHRYLPGWCAVHEGAVRADPDPARQAADAQSLRSLLARRRSLLRSLRLEFARLDDRRAPRRGQPTGADIDIDAVVDRHGAMLAAKRGQTSVGEGRLYVARRPAPPDVATLLLIDRSLSSDSWVAGRRVLDVAREATLLLGEMLQDAAIPTAVAAFCSHSRRDCRFDWIQRFGQRWAQARSDLFGLRPDGYTRIGPALRHATTCLARQPARRRLLLVISDCKPVDHDHYEGRRGIGDVRQALREATRLDIHTLALAIDRRAEAHLPSMFGATGFRVMTDAGSLATALARLHERLLR